MPKKIYDKTALMNRAILYLETLAQERDPLSGAEVVNDFALSQPELKACFRHAATVLRRVLDGRPHPPEDLPLIERDVDWMYRLSYGAEPVNVSELPDGSPLLQEALAVCFRYVYLVLQQAAEPPFDGPAPIPPEVRSQVVYSQDPVSVIQFSHQVGDLLGYTLYARALHPAVARWLSQNGYTELSREGGRTPTQRGLGAGLVVRQYVDRRSGETSLGLGLGEAAQRLIVDHLEEVLACEAAACSAFLELLTPELCISVKLLQEPVSLTCFLREQVTSLLPPDAPIKLNAAGVNTWFVKEGQMENWENKSSGDRQRRPVLAGLSEGIAYHGKKTADKRGVLWEMPAQRYLVDHLREIVRDMRSGDAYRPGDAT